MAFFYDIATTLVLHVRKALNFAFGGADERADERPEPSPAVRTIKIPGLLSCYKMLHAGATGWVYKIDDRIAVKYCSEPDKDYEGLKREMAFFDILEKHEPCPDIIQSFLRVPRANFLALMSGGSLHTRLEAHQKRSDDRLRVLEVTWTASDGQIKQWLMELCNAATWLESLGYVHGDIRPPNVLFDSEDHLKLADFDCVARIGTPSQGAAAPWARFLGPEAGSEEGTYGACGPRTEQFAIGSILYCLTRGYEPYEMDDLEDITEPIDLMQRMEFPALGDGHLDTIIERCWRGQFPLLRDLSEVVKSLRSDNDLSRPLALTPEYCSEMRSQCQRLVDSGLFVFS